MEKFGFAPVIFVCMLMTEKDPGDDDLIVPSALRLGIGNDCPQVVRLAGTAIFALSFNGKLRS